MDALSSVNIEKLESSVGYNFTNKKILFEALTHKSKHFEDPRLFPDYNERLEFLGDSILSLIIAEILFKHPLNFNEAQMSKMKSYLVKETVLFDISKTISLGDFIFLGNGEETTGGRQKKSILADAVEALIGAIYLDSNYEVTKKVVEKLFTEKINNVIDNKEGADFKSELQEICQELYGTLPEYKIVNQEGEDHKKIFTVEVYINNKFCGKGVGKSKKEAEMLSAKEALSRKDLKELDKREICIYR
ncbi:MAG TPA: ribonuclease III [Nitrospirae bacterium]|nr:ribonuclease III [Nitrospirota bacterium]